MLDRRSDIIYQLDGLTQRLIAYRTHYMNSRLAEKLKQAGQVAARQHAKIEQRADNIIAREQVIEQKTDDAFRPHEVLLDQAEQGLHDLEKALATVSNDPLQDLKRAQGGLQSDGNAIPAHGRS